MDRNPERIGWRAASRSVHAKHYHVVLGRVNDHEVILAVNEVAYPWHRHPESDELLIVVEGLLEIDSETGAPVKVTRGEAALIPAGARHRTRPLGRTVNLIVRRSGAETAFDES